MVLSLVPIGVLLPCMHSIALEAKPSENEFLLFACAPPPPRQAGQLLRSNSVHWSVDRPGDLLRCEGTRQVLEKLVRAPVTVRIVLDMC